MFENEKLLLRVFSAICASIACIGNFKDNITMIRHNVTWLAQDIYEQLVSKEEESE